MSAQRRGIGRTLGAGALAAVVAAIVFAPIMTRGFCADAESAEQSFCHISQHSIIGVETGLWVWLGATAVLVSIAMFIARPRRSV